MSLYERVGGEHAVQAAVVKLYERLTADPSVSRYFEGLDLERLIQKQIAFVTMALGGPHAYTGRDLRAAHAKLDGLSDGHFDAVAGHLGAVLTELGVDEPTVAEVLAVVGSTRSDVLSR